MAAIFLASTHGTAFGAGAPDAGADDAGPAAVTTPPATDTGGRAGPLPTSPTEQRKQAAPSPSPPGRANEAIDYVTPRYEPTGIPTFGGDTDIGAEAGVAASLTRFGQDIRPYIWNLNVVLSASFKDDNGFRLVQQNYFAALDIPHVDGSAVRLMPALGYVRTINAPYFGRGNGPKSAAPPGTADPTEYNQYLAQTFFLRELTRIVVRRPYEIVVEPILRYVAPRDYAGSRLETDAAAHTGGAPIVRGFRDEPVLTLAAGLIVDSRDNELFPTRGVFHQIGLKYVQGFPLDGDVAYGGASGVFAGYIPLGGESVLALRGVLDFDFGHVPFFDLASGGPFRPLQLPGGSTGVRGVPLGLSSGLIKVVGNVEVRSLFAAYRVFRQKIRLGGDAFVDAGRAFDDYTFASPRDGSGIGVHFGLGGGLYVGWGDAALIRLEVAYSPDAFPVTLPFSSGGPPLGIYVQNGIMF